MATMAGLRRIFHPIGAETSLSRRVEDPSASSSPSVGEEEEAVATSMGMSSRHALVSTRVSATSVDLCSHCRRESKEWRTRRLTTLLADSLTLPTDLKSIENGAKSF